MTLEERYMNMSRRSGRQPQREYPPQRRPKAGKKPRRRSGPRAVFWAFYKFVAIVSALIVAVYVGGSLLIRPPEIPQSGGQDSQTAPVVNTEGDTQEEQGRVRRDGVYNIALLGKDVDSGNTDTIIVVSYDVPNQKVGMISIPRDTAVERSWRKQPKINGAFYGAGADVLKEEIEYTFGIPIDYYILVDLKGFIALVDQLDGVEVNVPLDMNYDDPIQNLHIHFNKGTQTLNGQEAMEVVRYRHDNSDSPNYRANMWYSDVQRGEMQRQVLMQLAKKVVSWNSVPKVMSFLDIFNQYIKTDLSASNLAYFATQALQVDLATGVSQGTLEGEANGVYKGTKWCFIFKAEDILPVLNEQVNPYNQPLTEEDLHLVVADSYC